MKSAPNIKGHIRRKSHFKPETSSPWSSFDMGMHEWIPYLSLGNLKNQCPTINKHIQYFSASPDEMIRLWLPRPIYPESNILKEDSKSQISALIDDLSSSFTFINQSDIITFLDENEIDLDEILECFTEINKLVSSQFPENIKMFVQKYDDPETKDHYISIDVRHRDYPDEFIDKIWEIRDAFSEKFDHNMWLLLTTDYKPLD